MSTVTIKCGCCTTEFSARLADLRRGWGKYCSKSCAAIAKQEGKKGKKRKPNSKAYTQALDIFGISCLTEINNEEDILSFHNMMKLLR